jgi:siroheme synthase
VVLLVSGDVDTGSDEQAVLEDIGIAVEVVPGIAEPTAKVFPFMSREDIANEILRAAS